MDLEKYRSSIRLGRRAGNGCAGETLANLRASSRGRKPERRRLKPSLQRLGGTETVARNSVRETTVPYREPFGPFCRGDTFRFWTCKNFKVDTNRHWAGGGYAKRIEPDTPESGVPWE